MRIRIAVGGLVVEVVGGDVRGSHTLESGFLAPLERIVQHGLIRDWEQRLREVFSPREGIQRGAGTAEDHGLEADGGVGGGHLCCCFGGGGARRGAVGSVGQSARHTREERVTAHRNRVILHDPKFEFIFHSIQSLETAISAYI